MRFMMAVSPTAAIGRACSGAPCLITYQSGPIRMQARLREIQRERKGEAQAYAQQNCFTFAHTRALSMPHRYSKDAVCTRPTTRAGSLSTTRKTRVRVPRAAEGLRVRRPSRDGGAGVGGNALA
jgi:hypothetical protein